jgi:hypothetical protein
LGPHRWRVSSDAQYDEYRILSEGSKEEISRSGLKPPSNRYHRGDI